MEVWAGLAPPEAVRSMCPSSAAPWLVEIHHRGSGQLGGSSQAAVAPGDGMRLFLLPRFSPEQLPVCPAGVTAGYGFADGPLEDSVPSHPSGCTGNRWAGGARRGTARGYCVHSVTTRGQGAVSDGLVQIAVRDQGHSQG